MPKRVKVPGVGIIEFPDDMPDVRIEGIIRTQVLRQTQPEAKTPTGALVEQAQGAANRLGITPGGAARFAASSGLGVAGSVAGAMGGAAIGGPVGGLAGEMAGSYGARKLSVALGLEEPGMVGDIASVAAPPLIRGAGALVKGFAKRLPGVGTALQEEGVETTRQMVEGLTPTPGADTLYKRVAEFNPQVDLAETRRVAQEMLDEQMKLAPKQRLESIVDTAEGWLDMANAPQGADFQSTWLAQKILRQKIWGGAGLPHHERGLIDAAIMKDFEGIPGPVASVLKEANQTYRKERGVDALNEIIESGIRRPQGQPDAIEALNGGNMVKAFNKKVRQDDLFAGAFTDAEQREIRSILTDVAKIPVPGPVSGAMYGAGFGLGTGSAGYYFGLDPQYAAGITAAMTILPHLLGTTSGRAVVKGLSKTGRLMTPEGMAAMRGFLRATGQEVAEPSSP
jgi:hypothetical protein